MYVVLFIFIKTNKVIEAIYRCYKPFVLKYKEYNTERQCNSGVFYPRPVTIISTLTSYTYFFLFLAALLYIFILISF